MAKKGILIILSGPSGVGKGTIRKQIMKNKDLDLCFSISMTTRSKREKEIDGKDYYFVTREEFLKRLADGCFLEHCEFVGNFYGTPLDKVEELRNQGKNVLLEIEITGATQVLEKLKDDPGLVTIFLAPPSLKALEARIRGRKTEDEKTIQARLEKARREIGQANMYQYTVINDRVWIASKKVTNIILNKIRSID